MLSSNLMRLLKNRKVFFFPIARRKLPEFVAKEAVEADSINIFRRRLGKNTQIAGPQTELLWLPQSNDCGQGQYKTEGLQTMTGLTCPPEIASPTVTVGGSTATLNFILFYFIGNVNLEWGKASNILLRACKITTLTLYLTILHETRKLNRLNRQFNNFQNKEKIEDTTIFAVIQ